MEEGRGAHEHDDRFDLEDRLLDYAAKVIYLVELMPTTRAGNHVAGQLLRSGTSPLPNHGEAQAAESRDDFIHKMKIGLKELRESRRWLRLIKRTPLLGSPNEVGPVVSETNELIRIFSSRIRTAQANSTPRSERGPKEGRKQ